MFIVFFLFQAAFLFKEAGEREAPGTLASCYINFCLMPDSSIVLDNHAFQCHKMCKLNYVTIISLVSCFMLFIQRSLISLLNLLWLMFVLLCGLISLLRQYLLVLKHRCCWRETSNSQRWFSNQCGQAYYINQGTWLCQAARIWRGK